MGKSSLFPSVRIGTSGWIYPHWQGRFYPLECPKAKWLEYYARHFDVLELNVSFYRLPDAETFRRWSARTPAGFIWTVKMNHYITHILRLKNVEEAMSRFYDAVSSLDDKLGPIVIQLPPSLIYENSLVRHFLGLLDLSRKHAIEVRHGSWVQDEFMELLRQHNVAFCISDTAGRYPMRTAVTADYVYLRLHGSRRLYASLYTEEELRGWAEMIRNWSRETWVFFDNDFEGNAVRNAIRLREICSGGS